MKWKSRSRGKEMEKTRSAVHILRRRYIGKSLARKLRVCLERFRTAICRWWGIVAFILLIATPATAGWDGTCPVCKERGEKSIIYLDSITAIECVEWVESRPDYIDESGDFQFGHEAYCAKHEMMVRCSHGHEFHFYSPTSDPYFAYRKAKDETIKRKLNEWQKNLPKIFEQKQEETK